jgi:predicted PurR-regulated permease PerM
MPVAESVIWTGISALILIMLGIIGYLINSGFDSLKQQLQTLWDKLDKHQDLAEKNARDISELKARCEERHQNHARWSDV